MQKVFTLLCMALSFGFSTVAEANLLINPTRVQFGPTDRSADVTLINTSDAVTTYRLEWTEKQAQPDGGYTDLTPEQALVFPVASKMLRFTPRQVTLQPGERQNIKLALRRPANLAKGEYRSHLLFKAVPPEKNVAVKNEGASLGINIVLSFSIPVTVRQGELQYSLAADSVNLQYDPALATGAVNLKMRRTGLNSTLGDISAYWTPENGTERLIAKNAEYSFWPELSETTVKLHWVGADFAIANGTLRVVYDGSKNFKGTVFFEKTFNISKEMIKAIN